MMRVLQQCQEGCWGGQRPQGGEDIRCHGAGGIARGVHAAVRAAGGYLLCEPFA
jgi:hypothetical protein